MPGPLKEKVKQAVKRLYEFYGPEGWLQVYYPLYYLDKVIKNEGLYPMGKQRRAVQVAVPGAIAAILAWILWINIRFLLRDVFRKKTVEKKPSSRAAEKTDDDFATFTKSQGMIVPDGDLETDPDRGLSQSEVKRRQKLYGPNELQTSPDYFYLVRYFSTHSVSLPLEITAVVAIILHDWLDFIVLGVLLAWHLGTGGYSMKQSHDVLISLAGDIKMTAVVVRDAGKGRISASDLVPGDIVQISQGETVPADMRLLKFTEKVAVDQSAITGESNPINKHLGDMLYYTTGILQGDAIGIVVASATHSFIGRTVSLVGGNSLQPSSVRALKDMPYYAAEYVRVERWISAMTCITLLSILIVGWTVRQPVDFHRFLEFALGTAIVHVATGRATVIQFLRSLSTGRLSEGKAITQNGVITAEALAGIDVLCTDKTGTLTANDLQMSEPYCINCTPDDIYFVAALGLQMDDTGKFINLDPIDRAYAEALEAHPEAMERWRQYKVLEFTPFDPVTKMITAVVESSNGERLTTVRGAPKAVLELCLKGNPDIQQVEDDYREAIHGFVLKGLRALAVARKVESLDAKWELLGATPLFDPPRESTAPSVRLAESIGIDIKLITGDASTIAKSYAKPMGLRNNEVFFAGALREYLEENPQQPEPDIVKRASEACIFSETFPEDKQAIIKFFQNQGHRVAVTGDGANDQQALHRADCGIAVEGAAEAAQCAADVVCLAPGLARIIDSMQVSRQAFQQVRTYLIYRTALGLHFSIILFASYLIYGNSPADLRWFMVNVHISDVIGMQLAYDGNGRTPFPKKPARWRIGRILGTTLALAALLIAGSYFTILATPQARDVNEITLGQQTVFLGASLTDHWLCLLLLTNGRFWTHLAHWKSLSLVLVLEIPGRLSYFGWAGEGTMNASVAIRIWLIGFGILCASAAICWFASDSKLVHKQVRFEEEDDEDDAGENEMADEEAALKNNDTED